MVVGRDEDGCEYHAHSGRSMLRGSRRVSRLAANLIIRRSRRC
jgi:hypothetical protein